MSFFEGFKSFLGFTEETPVRKQSFTALKGGSARVTEAPVEAKPEPKPIQFDSQRTNIIIIEPRNIDDDYNQILQILKAGHVVMINAKYLDVQSSKHLLDTAVGVLYALGGHMQRVGSGIFLCAPEHVNVISEEQNEVIFNEPAPAAQPEPVPQYAAATGTYNAQPAAPAFKSNLDYTPASGSTQTYFY